MGSSTDTQSARNAYYGSIASNNLKAAWEAARLNPRIPEPRASEAPVIWHYERVRPFLLEAAGLISVEESERRVLILENPALPGQSRATQSLFAGLQIIMPGEVAPSHRHSPTALRLMIEGKSTYTSVDGERTMMKPGDFVITRAWSWHDHGNEGDGPAVWLDGLDIPLVRFLNAFFYQDYQEAKYPVVRPDGDSLARYGSGMIPADYKPNGQSSPIVNYPYERTREALEVLARGGEIDPCHGIRLRFTNPATGDHAMPTMGAFAQMLPRSFAGRRYRSTDSTIYSVIEGRGRTTIEGRILEWGPRDVFVAPAWLWRCHEASDDAVLFSFSDRAVQEKLDLWREQRE